MTVNDIVLPGSAKSTSALRACDKCGKDKQAEGGTELRPGRWYCATCWRIFQSRK